MKCVYIYRRSNSIATEFYNSSKRYKRYWAVTGAANLATVLAKDVVAMEVAESVLSAS